jgi:hypothetical protein
LSEVSQLILEKAINKRILVKIEKIKKKNPVVFDLLKNALWQEYISRDKQTWHYTQWYMKQIEKRIPKEE